jgi:hypothetical protein
MKRLSIGLTTILLATMLAPVSIEAARLAFDAAGNLFVPHADSVLKFTADGTKSTFATGLYPLGLCFDDKGNLFVSDGSAIDPKSRLSILKFTSDGKRSTFAAGISSVGMAFDHSGNLFVSQGDSIFKFTPKGVKSTFIASKKANFIDLAFDGANNLFVVDQGWPVSIVKITPGGAKTTFASGLSSPEGLAVDSAGDLFVAEQGSILKFTPDGTRSTFASPGLDLYGMAFDRAGNLFAARWESTSIFKFTSDGTSSTFASDLVSPDKQWEYKCADRVWPEIVKAGTTQVVLEPSRDLDVNRAEEAEVVWAPDSKRVAFNYTKPSAHHTFYHSTALYQLRGDKWVLLRSPVDESSERLQLAQLTKEGLPKSAYSPDADWSQDILKLRKWTDANTAMLYAYAVWADGSHHSKAAFLFTMKFDPEGNWKIVKTHQMSKKELEEEQ